MILTKSWLNEWIDLHEITTDAVCKKLNSLGLEVDAVESVCVPEKVVVGKIVSCKKHPDADKLNVCEVDVGVGKRQIVCGAKNVVDATYVAVAMIGATLPGGLEIKHAKLRGVDSEGMICSSNELGFAKINDGIMILDESIGKLEIGKELREYDLFNDDVIEIDLTPNRGDCLSIYGVARDLSAAFNKELKRVEEVDVKESIGIGKSLSFTYEDIEGVNLHYKIAEVKDLQTPLKMQLRLAQIEQSSQNDIENVLHYASHESGVVINAYDFEFFGEKKAQIFLARNDDFIEVTNGKECAYKVGIAQNKAAKAKSQKVIFEASYIKPQIIVPLVATHKIQPDSFYFKTSRGSEPNVDFGIDILTNIIAKNSQSTIYSGSSTFYAKADKKSISINLKEIEQLIGQSVDKTEVSNILKHLGFTLQNLDGERFGINVPPFRHDIVNTEDVTEEIIRMIGIDNIASKPLAFPEANRINEVMKNHRLKRELKLKAVAQGYFEVMTYVFSENAKLAKYGFETVDESLAIVNPITSEMDGFRTTLLVNLLEAVQRNFNHGKKSVKLFELGTVFDAKRNEKEQMAFVFSGLASDDNVANSGKAKDVTIEAFIDSIGAVIGDFELSAITQKNGFLHPYQSANIVKEGTVVGYLSKLHPNTEFEIPATYICVVDVAPILPQKKEVKEISKFQASTRDLSIVVDKALGYESIKQVLDALEIENLKSFYPVDVYEDKSLKNKKSLTIRFVIQSSQKTLQDEELNPIMDTILQSLQQNIGAALR